ncbi:MAG TPA: hypothetical protein VMH78_04455 [Thermoplasmata archaeon]|nr:hypothetical protein [Thermoplasmata archaeon]
MRIEQSDFAINYLAVAGKYLTNSGAVATGASATGPVGASVLTDWIKAMGYRELAVNLTVGAPTGSSPTLSLKFLVLDPIESSNGVSTGNTNPPVVTLPLTPAALTGAAHLRLVIAGGTATVWVNDVPTTLGALDVPSAWQLQLTVGGSYGSGQGWGVIGTYELRR